MLNNQEILTDSEIVKSDKATIYLGNIFTVDTDLQLPSEGKLGSKITWKSKNEKVLKNDGKITPPEETEEDETVTLVATITKGEAVDIREYQITVLHRERVQVITELMEAYVENSIGICPELPGVIITIKDDGSFGIANAIWNKFNELEYSRLGTFKVNGSVSGTNLIANCIIKVNPRLAENHDDNSDSYSSLLVKPFELDQVSLEDEVFIGNRDRDEEYLLSIDDDQMLYNFRAAAGLDLHQAAPLEGWDAPDCNLRGHTTGHYLTALAQAYASSEKTEFKNKIGYMIRELGKCQEAMEKSGKFSPGFLSGYSEEQFIKLEELTTYPTIWAPYYTLHKIMAGLLDCYQLARNEEALNICKKMGGWVYNRLKRLSKDKRNEMWSLYIAGEFGGMNEVKIGRAHV